MFEMFIHLVCEEVIENFSFYIQYQNQKLPFLDSQSIENIKLFLRENLRKIPHSLVDKINEYPKVDCLAKQICGVKKFDSNIHLASGKGIHFTGLTKLCFDAAKPVFLTNRTIHPFLSYHDTIAHQAAYSISAQSLNNINDPLNTTLKILHDIVTTNDDRLDVQA